MKCTNCGKELAPTAKFCNQCGTRVPEMEEQVPETPKSEVKIDKAPANKNKSLFLVIGIFFVAILIGLFIKGMGSLSKNPSSKNTQDPAYEAEHENTEEDYENTEEQNEDAVTDSTMEGNVEEEVLIIREKYNKIVDEIEKNVYTKHILEPGVTVYAKGTEIKAMEIEKNVNMESYDRFYYFDQGELFFAYWEDADSHRMYFKEENLIRWRYCKEAGKTGQAVNYDLEDAQQIGDKAEFAKAEISDYKTLWNRMNSGILSMKMHMKSKKNLLF